MTAESAPRPELVPVPVAAPAHASMPAPRDLEPLAALPLALLALLKLAVQLAAIPRYGYFRDELYYLACADHPALGYVDQAPLSIWILAAARPILGTSLFGLRLLPALAGVATVVIAGLIARELGGGRAAQTLAGLAAIVSPIYLALDHYYSMNAFDLLVWSGAFWILARFARTRDPRLWIPLGLLLGAGLLNKISVLWLGAGIAAGLALTAHRRVLLTKGPWIAAALSLALFAPHLLWQAVNGAPTLEFMRNAAAHKMAAVSIAGFLASQVLDMNPLLAPLWIGGLVWLLVAKRARHARILGVVYLTVLGVLLFLGRSRAYYLTLAYPPLLAAGAVAWERLTRRRGLGWTRPALLVLLLASGILMAPLALPLLPVESYIRYAKALGVAPKTEERQELGELPQHYADMFGWEELADAVARAYRSLPPEDRARCSVFAQNYGEAGAIDFFGRARGLPRALSGHNSYWMWGPGDATGEVMIVVGGDLEDNREVFEELEQVDLVKCALCMPYERDMPVYVGRRLKKPLRALWPELKRYI